jgi:predicted O-linked N-acetylglucosamine transferase (SPINDLY family)
MTEQDAIEAAVETAAVALSEGRLEQAEALCNKIIELSPDSAPAYYLLSQIASAAEAYEDALELLHRAIELDPSNSAYRLDSGRVNLELNRTDAALNDADKAVRHANGNAQTHYDAGVLYSRAGDEDRAERAFARAVELRPNFPKAFNLRGHALRKARDFDGAIDAFSRALALEPNFTEARNNLGCLLQDVGRLDAGIATFEQGILRDPDCAALQSNRLYALHFDPRTTPQSMRDAHADWERSVIQPKVPRFTDHANDRSPDRRLRIGYVSPDFRGHCQSMFVLPLLRHHNRDQLEVFCYSDVRNEDQATALMRDCVHGWREVLGQSDEQVAERIREDRVDVLIDLTLHMARNRLTMFARKPAPVQVSYLGYPGTTGLSAVDYRLTDPYLDPLGENDSLYAESSHRLPHTFWCFDPFDDTPVNDLPALRNPHITFGCFNNFCKVSPVTLRLWKRVLEAVPSSRLKVLAPRGSARRYALDHLQVDPSRIEFCDFAPRGDYLRRYHDVDLCLDTFPYNGHTTTLDGLWMGVPVVSLCGQTPVSRAGLSLLSNVQLAHQFVATTDDQFVEFARSHCENIPGLQKIRTSLRERMLGSPLMDYGGFTRDVESAYRTFWKRFCVGAAR